MGSEMSKWDKIMGESRAEVTRKIIEETLAGTTDDLNDKLTAIMRTDTGFWTMRGHILNLLTDYRKHLADALCAALEKGGVK